VEGGDPAMICDQHVALCDESIAAVARSKSRQDELLPEIFDANDRWIRARQQDPLSIEKDGVISSIEQSATRFINLHAQLSAGITFYSNLQSRLSTLQQNCDDLIFTQQLQRQEFESEVEQAVLRASQVISLHATSTY